MRSLSIYRLAIAVSVGLGLAGAAHAQRGMAVYLNDVRLDGGELRGQTLTGVDVRFDDNGDIRIIAKGYKITAESAAKPATPAPAQNKPGTVTATAPATARRYFIATQPQGRVGAAQYDIDVFINMVFVKRFRSKDPDPMLEITKFLHPGQNTIRFQARKEQGERISSSPTDAFELVIGDGEMNAGQLMLSRIASYKRTAAETAAFNTDMTLELPAAQ